MFEPLFPPLSLKTLPGYRLSPFFLYHTGQIAFPSPLVFPSLSKRPQVLVSFTHKAGLSIIFPAA